jgi:uncharacterized glyoxalase superfamily protein PhnB
LLEFKIDFEHRFGDNSPIYLGLSRSGCVLHWSEHHGDACPGAQVRIRTADIDQLSQQLAANDYTVANPGQAAEMPWGSREITVSDPFSSRLTSYQDER